MGERVNVGPDPTTTVPPVDYGRADPTGDRMRKASGFFRERFDGLLVFLGEIIAMLGGHRRAGFAVTIAALSGGLGECLSHGFSPGGVFWMTAAGFSLGLYLPVPGKR